MDLRTLSSLAAMLDYACFAPGTSDHDVILACQEAQKWTFSSVCVEPKHVWLANQELRESLVVTSAVILPADWMSSSDDKREEAKRATDSGALSIDWYFNHAIVIAAMGGVGYDRKMARNLLTLEIRAIVESVASAVQGTICKVTLNCDNLTQVERTWIGNLLAVKCGDSLQFIVATSDFEAPIIGVRHMVKATGRVSKHLRTQAGGNIRTLAEVIALRDSGASRIGTAYAPEIMREATALGWRDHTN